MYIQGLQWKNRSEGAIRWMIVHNHMTLHEEQRHRQGAKLAKGHNTRVRGPYSQHKRQQKKITISLVSKALIYSYCVQFKIPKQL